MRPLVPPQWYHDEAVFQLEQRMLFGRVWQFVGFTRDLMQPNDFITADVGGQSVLVQNFGGDLRAFANVCSHRFARIHCDAKGNGKLRCGYHGWIYNSDGVPFSIPSRPRFDDLKDRSELQKLALRRYDLEQCGSLVFVREQRDENTEEKTRESLREFLGETFDTLEQLSNALGTQLSYNDLTFRCNWKIVVENGLEAYHVGFVHENTFKPLGMTGMDFRFAGKHSAWMAPVDESTGKRMRKLATLSHMPYRVPGYLHQYVYPNITVSTLCGATFGFQIMHPVSPTETRIGTILFLSRMEADEGISSMVHDMLGPSTAEFTLRVANEDRGVCEAVQLGVAQATQPGILSEEEERVLRFQEAYMDWMAHVVPASVLPKHPERAVV